MCKVLCDECIPLVSSPVSDKTKGREEVPLVSRADLLTVQSMPVYNLWHHLLRYVDKCAGAGRAFPSFGFGVLVMELLLTSIVRWFCAYPFCCSQESGFVTVLVIWGLPFNNLLEYAKPFCYLNLHVILHCPFPLLHLSCCYALAHLVLKFHFASWCSGVIQLYRWSTSPVVVILVILLTCANAYRFPLQGKRRAREQLIIIQANN